MEKFENAKVVRLRSHHHKYLWADDDEETVIQARNDDEKNAKWSVEFVENLDSVRFKSCYGKYLTATNLRFLIGRSGKQVTQTSPERLDSSVEWEVIGEGDHVRLKTRYGRFLRAYGGVPPWRNGITHDIPQRTSAHDCCLWELDVVETQNESQTDESSKEN